MNDPVLRVQMLGGFNLQLDDTPVPPVASRPASSLLAFLILRRDRPQTRDILAGRFWSDLAEDKARRRLSNALWQIRRAVRTVADVELLTVTSTTIGLNRNLTVEVDVEHFEQRLDELERAYRNSRRSVDTAELAAVVESYHGDLLDGHYDEWIDDQRHKVRERHLQALATLVQMYTGEGAYEAALRHGRALVAAEPLSEERHREVMRLYALNEQPSAAERQYAQCRDILFSELQVEPSEETNQLLERIRREAASPSAIAAGSDNSPPPFVGRSAERSALLARLNELVAGKGGMILVEGEPGIGKSRLLEEAIQGAEWRGVQVLVGHHFATSALSPFEGIREMLAPATRGIRGERLVGTVQSHWLGPASTVLEELRRHVEPAGSQALRPEEERWRTAEALAQVILGLGRAKPALLVLEDLHWCDEDTMQVLVQLGHWLIDSGILLCVSYQRDEAQRSPAIWTGLGELEAKPGASRHVIPPLDEDEVRQLVTAELGPGRMSAAAVAQLTRTTVGNPYLIIELLRSPHDVFDADGLTLPELGTDDGAGALLPRLTEFLGRRLGAVADDVRAVLEAVSAMTGPATTNAVAGVVGLERREVVSALAEAVEGGFLSESERGFEFTQEQTRRLVYDAVEPDLRRRVHGRIVDALVGQSGVSVGQMAHHAWLAGHWPRAHQYHSLAADSALNVHAYHTAAEHFAKADHAAAEAGMDDRNRLDDLFAYERVLDILGRRVDQQQMLDRLARCQGVDPATTLLVGQRRAWLLAYTDRGPEAARVALEAIGPARAAGLPVGELSTIVGHARFWSGDLQGAIGPLRDAVEQLQMERASVAAPLLVLGRIHIDLQQLDAAQRYLEDALRLAKADNDARSQVEALGHLATLHHALRHHVKAENAFMEALELARSIGYRHGEGRNLVNLAAFHLLLGRGGRSVALFAEAAEVFASLGNGRGEAYVKVNAAELAHMVLGDFATARSQAEQAAVYFRQIEDQRMEAHCLVILASVDRRQGRRRLARRRLGDARAKARAAGDTGTEVLAGFNSGLVHLDLGRYEQALHDIQGAAAVASDGDLDALGPALLAAEARALAGLGRLVEAAQVANRAIDCNRPGATLAHLAAWWCSQVLAQVGQEREAAEQVALAHQLVTRHLDGLSDEVVAAVWAEVEEYRAILEARERYFVEEIELRLPRLETPTGRPLTADDLIDVVWTVSSPDDAGVDPAAARRQARILRLTRQAVEQGALARVSDLALALAVSERTIKRDLAELRSGGHRPQTRKGGEEKSL